MRGEARLHNPIFLFDKVLELNSKKWRFMFIKGQSIGDQNYKLLPTKPLSIAIF
jgi:hypothetical protein